MKGTKRMRAGFTTIRAVQRSELRDYTLEVHQRNEFRVQYERVQRMTVIGLDIRSSTYELGFNMKFQRMTYRGHKKVQTDESGFKTLEFNYEVRFNLKGSTYESGLDIRGSTYELGFNMKGSTYESGLDIRGSTYELGFNMKGSTYESGLDIRVQHRDSTYALKGSRTKVSTYEFRFNNERVKTLEFNTPSNILRYLPICTENLGKQECSNCKFLAEKIKPLEAKIQNTRGSTRDGKKLPEKHTHDSVAITSTSSK
ncbi:hypothetical protein Tco_0772393 [Tanacetum coccineum]|uniref:Uncharacterized protein n=1 Tax=Tanacetum coccineum TaxID=301880 RepID=A0ABQ4ZLF3_9ASTR